MGLDRGRPDPTRHPARRRAGRPLRPAEAPGREARATDAGARQPALPEGLPSHRRRGAVPSAGAIRRRSGATGRWPLVRARRPYRSAGRHRLCAGDPPRSGAQPARGFPLHSGPPSQAIRRSLARFARRDGPDRRGQSQHGRADAGLAFLDLLRARLSLAHARRAAGRRRRPGGARRRRLDQDAGGPAAGTHAAAPPRQLLRRSAGTARRLGAWRHRPGRDHALRQDRARQRAGLGPGRNAGADAVPRAALQAPPQSKAASCPRSTCGGWASRQPMPSPCPSSAR